MQKLALFWVIFTLLSSYVAADIHLVYPVEKILAPGDSVNVGKVMPGQTFKIVINPESGYTNKDTYDYLQVNLGLPKGWIGKNSEIYGRTDIVLTAEVTVPKNAQEGTYYIPIKASDLGNNIRATTATIAVVVSKNLIKASIKEPIGAIFENQTSEYQIHVVNTSIADATLRIQSNLPKSWAKSLKGTILAGKDHTFTLKVNPKISGVRNINIQVISDDMGQSIVSFKSKLIVNSTMRGALTSANKGLEIFPTLEMVFYNWIGFLFSWL